MHNTLLLYTLLTGCILLTGIITFCVSRQYLLLKYRKDTEQSEAVIREKEITLQMVANELHDNVGQLLFLQQLFLKEIWTIHPQPLVHNALRTNETIQLEIKKLCNIFHIDPDGAAGFEAMLESLIRTTDLHPHISTNTTIQGSYDHRLSREQELILIRIIQEVLHNCLRHTNANAFTFQIDYRVRDIHIVISDNHTEKKTLGNTRGLGQRSIAARAHLLQADYIYDFEKNTHFNMTIPVPNRKHTILS